MPIQTIYHICTQNSWEVQLSNHYYVHASLASEGFIHCSTSKQVEGVLERYFENQADLWQISIATAQLKRLVFEASTAGEDYPHVYGPIPKEAISEVKKIR